MGKRMIRVRFAPSPTGPLHMGGMRTALFNFLFARQNNGVFVLRIEDTDQARYVKGAEQYIIDSLEWCNISVDEGFHVGGDYGPYRQSERKSIYRKYAEKLVLAGKAYIAFDTQDDLEKIRKNYERSGETFNYGVYTREGMKNSLSLPENETQQRIESEEPYVIRFKIPENVGLAFSDIIRGMVNVNTSTLDDKILFKSDGMPTYHLANVVDDYLMKISHVIRGEEWLPSLPLHILLYQAFGWENDMPEFAHMPLTLKPDGKGKLSKREGDRMGFPVFPLEWTNPVTGEKSSGYRESGYFPEAFVNILAFLGWNPGTSQEIFSMEELIRTFSLERVVKAGSRFDPDKAKWYNHQYLQKKSNAELATRYLEILNEKGVSAGRESVEKIIGLIKNRANFIEDFWEQSSFFFIPPVEYDQKTVMKRWKGNTPQILEKLKRFIAGIDDFTSANCEKMVKEWIEENKLAVGEVMNPFRLVIVGAAMGPHLFDIIGILGKEETLGRIEAGLKKIRIPL
ncbi:MAG: glutamate--tRNA ligase [Bacteroidales bacterium]|nr:MAG: glutamate--tRNA ligase [Bacteroidales bacterium]